MKKFININDIFKNIKKKSVTSWLDKLTFHYILLIWVVVISVFGIVYYFFTNGNSFLLYNKTGEIITSVYDAIYFSFVTATTTGFGDILPSGNFKILSVVEVICGLLLLALVTSKLVSIKQNIILNEIYELSLNERIYRMRSGLLLFRQNISAILGKVEAGKVHKREIADIYMYIASFEDVLSEIINLLEKPKKSITKKVDPVNTELIVNSILYCFNKFNSLIIALNHNKLKWKREVTIGLIKNCIDLNDDVFLSIENSKIISKQAISNLKSRERDLIAEIKKNIKG